MGSIIKDGADKISELRFLLNNVSHAILFESLNHEILFVNQSFCDMFNIPLHPEALLGVNCSKAAEQYSSLFKEPRQFSQGIVNIYQGKKPITNEQLLFANGKAIYRDYKPISDQVFSGHLWTYKNFLELKSILSKVEEQKDFYEHLLNNIPADIAIFDKDHKYIFINNLAISKNDIRNWLIGKDDFDYCKQNNKPMGLAISRRAFFKETLKNGKAVEFEEINYANDGSRVYNLRRFFPLKNVEGTIENVIGYGINITKIKEREVALLEREKILSDLVDSADQLVVGINEALIIKYTNRQWSAFTNLSFDDSLKMEISTFVNKNKSSFVDNVSHFIREGKYKTRNRSVGITKKDGNNHILTYYICAFTNSEFKEKIFAIFFNDITAQLKAQNELKKVAKQERKLNELKSNFMNLVSHELRSPLSVILSNVELIDLKNSSIKEDPVPQVYMNRIMDQVDKMVLLINNFLFVSQAESGKIQFNPILFDINELVNQLNRELYSPWVDGRSLEVSVKGRIMNVMADKSMISHCLINIANNAFKYSLGKPTPKLRLKFNSKMWKISLLDYGIGITKEDKKNLFKSFTRGKNVGDIEGTGLGLMVVKLFVKQNKGSIFIKSNQHGTVVILQFPY